MTELWTKMWGMAYDKLLAMLTQPKGGVGVVEHIEGTGYSTSEDRMDKIHKLRQACECAVYNPAWMPGQPNPSDTHCNGNAAEVAVATEDYHALDGLLAASQIETLEADPDWRQDNMARASAHAQKGGLAYATVMEHPHAHIAPLTPDPMQRSDTWGEDVCMIANVGHENKLCRLSGGFRLEHRPNIRFFLYKPDEVA